MSLPGAGEGRDPAALFQQIYDELRRLAEAKMASEPRNHTLQPTALVHEVFLRLGSRRAPWTSRAQYFVAAAEAMRRILIERARRVRSAKRGGGRIRVSLHDGVPQDSEPAQDLDLVDLSDAIEELETRDARAASVVKLRYLAGLSVEETASALEISPRTVRNDWTFSRAWLSKRLSGHREGA